MNKFVQLIADNAKKYGNREALRFRDYKTMQWTSLSWNSFKGAIERCAQALYNIGVKEHGRICIFTQNCPEILISHFAAYYNRAVPAPIYATSSKDEAMHIINDSGATVIFSGDQNHYEMCRELVDVCPTLEHVVTLDTNVQIAAEDKATMTWQQFMATGDNPTEEQKMGVVKRKHDSEEDDLMCLIYTSGTTGEPKGVMLNHSNFNACIWAHSQRIKVDDENDVSLSFLPFSHIFELGWTMYCLNQGVRVAINLNPKEIQKAVKEIKPTCMCSVPRFWEKVYTAVNDNFNSAPPVLKVLIKRALSVGRTRNLKYKRNGRKVPYLIEKQYQFFEDKVFKKVRAAIGIENHNLFPVAGAMMSDRITEFLHTVGVNIVVGYGLSETTATVTCYEGSGWSLGTVGTPIPGWEVKIGENNEILVRGKQMLQGYFNKPEDTARAIDAHGWFHTGDCGEINEKGEIVLTDRIKDLFKTSNGKYIAPQVLETLLAQDKYIEQAVIIGDGRKYVSALIVPNLEELKAYALKKRINYTDVNDLVNNAELHKMIEDRINDYQKDMASYEQIKKFVLLPREFTMSTGELTNTLKVRRAVINKRYAPLIDAMYAADFRKKKKEAPEK
ncbi:MAG: long-chain fatty acid--CoA ligase [Muribaculaceae bacterium]|nr:long-chain fatty acid--CoA ligase [Muribaculaceae bacterium]